MNGICINPAALLAAAAILAEVAQEPRARKERVKYCPEPPQFKYGRCKCEEPRPILGVAGEPKEDAN